MQLSPGLCSTPLSPPFPADATLAAAGMSGCLRGGHSWEAQTGTLQGGWVGGMLQGVGEGDAHCHWEQEISRCTAKKHSSPQVPFSFLQLPEKLCPNSPGWQQPPSSSSHLSFPVWVTAVEPQAGSGGFLVGKKMFSPTDAP